MLQIEIVSTFIKPTWRDVPFIPDNEHLCLIYACRRTLYHNKYRLTCFFVLNGQIIEARTIAISGFLVRFSLVLYSSYAKVLRSRIKHRWYAIDKDNMERELAKREDRKYVPYMFRNGDTRRHLLARSRYVLMKNYIKWTEEQELWATSLSRSIRTSQPLTICPYSWRPSTTIIAKRRPSDSKWSDSATISRRWESCTSTSSWKPSTRTMRSFSTFLSTGLPRFRRELQR